VDDNLTSLEILAETLKSFGFQVGLASSGTEALEFLNPLGYPLKWCSLLKIRDNGLEHPGASQHQRLQFPPHIPYKVMPTILLFLSLPHCFSTPPLKGKKSIHILPFPSSLSHNPSTMK
jgi:CheY-like chemotaxis protein